LVYGGLSYTQFSGMQLGQVKNCSV